MRRLLQRNDRKQRNTEKATKHLQKEETQKTKKHRKQRNTVKQPKFYKKSKQKFTFNVTSLLTIMKLEMMKSF